MNILQLINQATAEMGLVQVSSVVSSSAADTIQFLALANALGSELAANYDWQPIQVEYRFYTVAMTLNCTLVAGSPNVTLPSAQVLDTTYTVIGTGINQDTYLTTATTGTAIVLNQNATASGTYAITFSKTKYAMPASYDRLVNKTQWDKTRHWEMIPTTAQQWQFLKSGFISSGVRVRFRLLGGFFQVWPSLPNNEYLGFEYISNQWVSDVTSVTKSAFTADTDTCMFSDRLMIIGIKLKYFQIKGFDTSSMTQDYNEHLSVAKVRDKGAPNLNMGNVLDMSLIGLNNVPDSGYGS